MKSSNFASAGVKRAVDGEITAAGAERMDFRGRSERARALLGADGIPPVIHRGAHDGAREREGVL